KTIFSAAPIISDLSDRQAAKCSPNLPRVLKKQPPHRGDIRMNRGVPSSKRAPPDPSRRPKHPADIPEPAPAYAWTLKELKPGRSITARRDGQAKTSLRHAKDR